MRKSKHNVTTKTGASQADHSKKINDEFIMLPTVDFCFKGIQVSIFDHVYFNEDDRCYRRIIFRDDKMNQEYTDLMEIHILELPKLPAEQQDETRLVQWMRFLGGKSREDFEKMAEKNPEIKEAYDMLDKMSADERKRLEYEERQKLIRDKMWIINGMKHQCEKAMQEGRERGMREGRLLNIREMLLDNVPLDKIKQYTKATDEEIENEQKKLNEEKPI